MNALLLTLALLRGGDSVTTASILAHGGHESNPLLPQNPALNLTITSAEGTATIYAIHRLYATHPKLARVMAIAGIVAEGYAVQHNLRTMASKGQR
jgi:hypothetical protein